ncbi:putative elongation factor 2 kinase [Rosellinia necatrix]|uniref:Putative elongation factor 2 kinase n=1 Tax=Rosellinia necatrix TaxID=77044 RepID=A0A1W2TSW4_ROSNE|nr:putative elongation factor 2 kinase [Rosellinia necatrix]
MSNARKNHSTSAKIDRDRLYSSGTTMNVYKGVYTNGERQGQALVAKEFKAGYVYEADYFDNEMKVISRAQKVVDDWNNARIIDKRIVLNRPQVWNAKGDGTKALIEPMIQNFEKFNSNSGWATNRDAWCEAMQALSHFSYHNSHGRELLCDIQGGSYQDGYILTDPVIMSERRAYGPTDLGRNGIGNFFEKHRCGRFCDRAWRKPGYRGATGISMRQGTVMMHHLPTRVGRNPLTEHRPSPRRH